MHTDNGLDGSAALPVDAAADDAEPATALPDGHPLHAILRDMRARYDRGGEL